MIDTPAFVATPIAGMDAIRAIALTPPRLDRPALVCPADISVSPGVFQPRLLGDGKHDRAHVAELVRALLSKPDADRFLDPVLVLPIGGAFYCVDGHHRLAAYTGAGIVRPVPVEHFVGSLNDAVKEAVQRNSRDHLVMGHLGKLVAAWRLVLLDAHSKSEIVEASTISDRTVGTMRSTFRALRENDEELDGLTWREAKRALRGKARTDFSQEMEAAWVLDWAKRLGKTFGPTLVEQPIILARALEVYSEGLPRALMEEWGHSAEAGDVTPPEEDDAF